MSWIFDTTKLDKILIDHSLAKFGDAVVNFIYNVAIYKALNVLQGVKVWDRSLAEACKKSPLMNFLTGKRNTGELADCVEAFVGFLYLKDPRNLQEAVDILTRVLRHNKAFSNRTEKESCSEAFTQLINYFCEKYNID